MICFKTKQKVPNIILLSVETLASVRWKMISPCQHKRTSVLHLVASSGEVPDCNQLITPRLTLIQACRRTFVGNETLEPMFGLSVLGYNRNMAVQHRLTKIQTFIFRSLCTNENMLMNIISNFCHFLPIDPPTYYTLVL